MIIVVEESIIYSGNCNRFVLLLCSVSKLPTLMIPNIRSPPNKQTILQSDVYNNMRF